MVVFRAPSKTNTRSSMNENTLVQKRGRLSTVSRYRLSDFSSLYRKPLSPILITSGVRGSRRETSAFIRLFFFPLSHYLLFFIFLSPPSSLLSSFLSYFDTHAAVHGLLDFNASYYRVRDYCLPNERRNL